MTDNLCLIGVVLALVTACFLAVCLTRGVKRAARKTLSCLHDYLSTACYHGNHDRCRKQCKFCCALCRCACHGTSREEVAHEAAVEA